MEKNKRKRNTFAYNRYKQQQHKKRRQQVLETGLKGFFCTCNGKEKECIKESYNILNYYADQLIGPEEGITDENGKESNEDIEDEINKEIDSLKMKSSPGQRRFQAVDTGANSCVFIKTTVEDPIQLVRSVYEDVEKTKQQKGRYLLRLVPIEVTCKAYIEDIRKTADQLFDKHFRCDPSTFCIFFNKRNNNSVLRDEVIEALACIITDKNIGHKADLKHPKLAVVIEIIKGICCMSVLTDYMKFKKYNIYELANPRQNQSNSEVSLEVKESSRDDGNDDNNLNNSKVELEGEESACAKSDDKDTENKHVEDKNERVEDKNVHVGDKNVCVEDKNESKKGEAKDETTVEEVTTPEETTG